MKDIIIKAAKNGWSVAPLNLFRDGTCSNETEVFVFNNIRDLQEQLPEILEVKPESQGFMHPDAGFGGKIPVTDT